jgi:FdhD protein
MSTIHLPLHDELDRRQAAETGPTPAPRQLVCPMTLQRYAHGEVDYWDDMVAVEEDLRIRVGGHPEMVLARTPGDDHHLVAGHLFSCSMVCEPGDILDIAFRGRDNGVAEVTLGSPRAMRRIYPFPRPLRIRAAQLFEFREIFETRQRLYKNTGSTHAAALISAEGELLAYGEDVGRHNAFDKAVGCALIAGTLSRAAIALLSSRLAQELTVKAATANIPILCGFSAATSAGIDFAERNNITLVGRIRQDTFNIYTNGWRILA